MTHYERFIIQELSLRKSLIFKLMQHKIRRKIAFSLHECDARANYLFWIASPTARKESPSRLFVTSSLLSYRVSSHLNHRTLWSVVCGQHQIRSSVDSQLLTNWSFASRLFYFLSSMVVCAMSFLC